MGACRSPAEWEILNVYLINWASLNLTMASSIKTVAGVNQDAAVCD